MKRYLALMLTILILLAGCAEMPVDEPTTSQTVEPTPEVLTASVDITRKAFVPQELVIQKGTIVTWINKDTIGHTISFYGGYKHFNGIVPSSKTHEVVFDEVGEFDYINGALGLKGKIIVE